MHTYMSLQGVCVSSRGFLFGGLSEGFLSEGFVRGGFCPSSLLSEYIHYNRKLNITFNFRFHMYEIFLKSVMSHALGPPSPVTNCHTFSDPFPSSVTYFMDGPLFYFSSTVTTFRTYFLYIIRYNNILRPIHYPARPPLRPRPKIWGRDPAKPPRIDAYA